MLQKFCCISFLFKPPCLQKEFPWQKKNTNLFDAGMGTYDGAEVFEIVVLFLLNNNENIIKVGMSTQIFLL